MVPNVAREKGGALSLEFPQMKKKLLSFSEINDHLSLASSVDIGVRFPPWHQIGFGDNFTHKTFTLKPKQDLWFSLFYQFASHADMPSRRVPSLPATHLRAAEHAVFGHLAEPIFLHCFDGFFILFLFSIVPNCRRILWTVFFSVEIV